MLIVNIDEIQTFLAIAELGGFTRAGRRLHRSQPAISRRLGLLEQELGAPMFERIRGRARLTEAGRAFLPHAEAALAALRDGRDAVAGLAGGMGGTIQLALVGTLADTRIIHALRGFQQRSTGVRLELRTASSREVTDLVRRGEAMLGLRYFASDRPELVSVAAGGEAMLVVAAAGHRLAGRRVRETRLLAGERWIGFPPTPGVRDSSGHVLARQLIRAGLDAEDITLIDSLTAQKRLAEAGFGLALVPESSVGEELRRGSLVALDVPAMRTTIPITAIHRRNGYLGPAARALLSLLTGGMPRSKAGRGGRRGGASSGGSLPR
jgi:DNA-binding transcriptional LysR family regulator